VVGGGLVELVDIVLDAARCTVADEYSLSPAQLLAVSTARRVFFSSFSDLINLCFDNMASIWLAGTVSSVGEGTPSPGKGRSSPGRAAQGRWWKARSVAGWGRGRRGPHWIGERRHQGVGERGDARGGKERGVDKAGSDFSSDSIGW